MGVFFTSCTSAPPPTRPHELPDPTKEAWYQSTVSQLADLNRQAQASIAAGRLDEASAAIQKSQPLSTRLLGVSHPTLEAMEAASDSDHLYASMLLANQHQAWARMLFQKNLSRWKNWRPQTDETVRRRKLAEAGIAECDRLLAK